MKRANIPEKIIFFSAGVALVATLALGILALVFSRSELAGVHEEARESARNEGRRLGGGCLRELEVIRGQLVEQARNMQPSSSAIDLAVALEPIFVSGFVATRDGRLVYAEPEWRRRYSTLFDSPGSVDWQEARRGMGTEQVLRGEFYNVQPKAQSNSPQYAVEVQTLPQNTAIDSSKVRAGVVAENRKIAAREAHSDGVLRDTALLMDAVPAATGFGQLIEGWSDGIIPWYTGNYFAPLIWAESEIDSGLIVGFELNSAVIYERLIPLLSPPAAGYIRIELTDASRLVHAVGATDANNSAIPVLFMPFDAPMVPNMLLRVSVIPELLPGKTMMLGVATGVAALVLTIVIAA